MDGQCPLIPQMFFILDEPLGLRHVRAIDDHISAKNCPHPPLKGFIFRGALDGCTPLLLACHYGEFDSVMHIVECWGVNIQSAATYYLHPSSIFMRPTKIESATPLFVAAFNGHSKIARYLLEKGADVNHKTSSIAFAEYDGLSPLYGAVSYNWLSQIHQKPRVKPTDTDAIVRSLLEFGADVVSGSYRPSDGRPIWMKPMCGVDATAALINYGLDLKQRDSLSYGGGTTLHYWASLTSIYTQEESLSIVNLLLSKDADLLHVQDKGGFLPIIRAANSTNLAVLEYLLERADVTRVEKIEALELAGAAILTNFAGDEELRQKAFDYWRRALHLRQIETEESGPIIKTPLVRLSGGKV